ncbi:hypothetical protein Tco_0770009 [Tanacetum coccineum]|uniref:Transposase (Putative), gypsy type n=1 Tax=Tanacetum coccineum TaxID=301880 RepID=A0ABQ4ZAZ1_9ASTR
MGSIDDIKSILTQLALDALCEKFHIPRNVHPELPGRNSRIRNSPTCKIGVYTRFFDFANYRIPLSQLSVIAAAKISHFEILCRVHNFVLTNDHFLWIDASVFPLAVPWHNNKTLRNDPHPTPVEFDADVCNYLADNPAPFRKFPEPFLCFVGISQYYELDDKCYPTFLNDDDEEMDLFTFIHHADPTKVRIGEREVREGEIPLLELTRGRVVLPAGVNEQGNQNEVVQDVGAHVGNKEGDDATAADQLKGPRKKRKTTGGASGSSLPPKKLKADHGTCGFVASTGGKSVVVLQSLLEHSTFVDPNLNRSF